MLNPVAWTARAGVLLGSLAAVWAVSLYGLYADDRLISALALLPRRADGLPGILTAPLVHASVPHLLANTLPLAVLGGMVAIRGAAYYVAATLAIAVLGGLGVWLVGREAAHVGASGVAFGYFGFLVARGWYERRVGSIAAAVLVVAVYGGMIGGVLPRADGVSWEGHLCGLLAGALCARTARRRKR